MGKRTPTRQLFYSSFISWTLLFAYPVAFYRSANTPVAGAGGSEVLEVAALGLAIAGAMACIVWLSSAEPLNPNIHTLTPWQPSAGPCPPHPFTHREPATWLQDLAYYNPGPGGNA